MTDAVKEVDKIQKHFNRCEAIVRSLNRQYLDNMGADSQLVRFNTILRFTQMGRHFFQKRMEAYAQLEYTLTNEHRTLLPMGATLDQ